MDIRELFGIGKAFEPPFHTDSFGSCIYDRNNQFVLEVVCFNHIHDMFAEEKIGDAYITIAEHVCKLLNQHWNNEKENQIQNT